jgi:thioredoxin reductase (NADPH)
MPDIPPSEFKTDIAVIGAGPIGLFTVFEAGMLGMRCVVFDALEMIGGQCTALYPENPIYDIPGHPVIESQALIERLAEQAAPFNPEYRLGHHVTAVERREDGSFLLTNGTGERVVAKAVVIAAGAGAFGPHRPPLAGLEAYEATGCVAYMVRRRDDYRGKRVVIAGGGDSAVDWALSLAELADQIMLVHRRPKFRAAPESAARLQRLADDGRIELVVPYQLKGLHGDDGRLTAVEVGDPKGEPRMLNADVLLPFYGLSMELGPIAEWGLNLDVNHVVVDPASGQTNVPGIFAIGDIASYPGKLKLILSGFSEAAMTCHAAHRIVFPDTELHFEYSTTRGVPGLPG